MNSSKSLQYTHFCNSISPATEDFLVIYEVFQMISSMRDISSLLKLFIQDTHDNRLQHSPLVPLRFQMKIANIHSQSLYWMLFLITGNITEDFIYLTEGFQSLSAFTIERWHFPLHNTAPTLVNFFFKSGKDLSTSRIVCFHRIIDTYVRYADGCWCSAFSKGSRDVL